MGAQLKTDIFLHYSNRKLACANCGETRDCLLVLDHIYGKSSGKYSGEPNGGGTELYRYLRNNEYPDGYQVLCQKCNSNKWHKDESSRLESRRKFLERTR